MSKSVIEVDSVEKAVKEVNKMFPAIKGSRIIMHNDVGHVCKYSINEEENIVLLEDVSKTTHNVRGLNLCDTITLDMLFDALLDNLGMSKLVLSIGLMVKLEEDGYEDIPSEFNL